MWKIHLNPNSCKVTESTLTGCNSRVMQKSIRRTFSGFRKTKQDSFQSKEKSDDYHCNTMMLNSAILRYHNFEAAMLLQYW